MEKAKKQVKFALTVLALDVVLFIALIPVLPHTFRVTKEFYTEVPKEQILDNAFKTDVNDVEGEEYRTWMCKNWNYLNVPEWMMLQDEPNYCGGAR